MKIIATGKNEDITDVGIIEAMKWAWRRNDITAKIKSD